MTMQLRIGGNPYHPGRDIVNLFRQIARAAAYGLGKEVWGVTLGPYAAFCGMSDDSHFAKGAGTLADFCHLMAKPEAGTLADALVTCGYTSLPAPVRTAILIKLGESVLSTAWNLSRDALAAYQSLPGLDEAYLAAERAIWDAARLSEARRREDMAKLAASPPPSTREG